MIRQEPRHLPRFFYFQFEFSRRDPEMQCLRRGLTIYNQGKTMITVGMNYHVIEGKQEDFEAKFAAVIEALNAAEGHTTSTLWKDVSDGASYLITSEWSDEDAFSAFIQSEAFRNVTNWGKEQILSDRPRHKIYKS